VNPDPSPDTAARGTAIITRPTGQSGSLAAALGQRGFASLLLPVFDIAPVTRPALVQRVWARSAEFDLIHFASANAIKHFFAHRPAGQAFKPGALIAVMGPGSRAVVTPFLGDAPVQIVTPGQELAPAQPAALDSETLMVTLETVLPGGFVGKRALLVKGDGGRDWLARALTEAGMQAEGIAVYRRLCPLMTPAQADSLRARAAAAEPTAFVVTSSEGAQNLVTMLAPEAALMAWALATPVVVTHARVAQRARTLGFTRVLLSAPNDDAVVRTIESAC